MGAGLLDISLTSCYHLVLADRETYSFNTTSDDD
jgi:hypothetical protein